jgi:hypothetical protein
MTDENSVEALSITQYCKTATAFTKEFAAMQKPEDANAWSWDDERWNCSAYHGREVAGRGLAAARNGPKGRRSTRRVRPALPVVLVIIGHFDFAAWNCREK